MAIVVVTIKIMPTGPDVDMNLLYDEAVELVREFVDDKHKDGEVRKEIEEIGFGIKALRLLFVMDESIGSTDELENKIKDITNVESVETVDVRRAIG